MMHCLASILTMSGQLRLPRLTVRGKIHKEIATGEYKYYLARSYKQYMELCDLRARLILVIMVSYAELNNIAGESK